MADKSKKDPDPKIDGASVIADGRFSVLRSTNESDLLKNANAAKKYTKGSK